MSNELINRQYVGARYVPKIMGEWNKALQYEALSIVTYKNNSFTSKIPVPANVDISNENYWVNTANYNAQVTQYEKNVREYNAKVTEYEKNVRDYKNDTDAKIKNVDSDIKIIKNNIDNINSNIGIIMGNDAIIISDSYGVSSVVGANNWVTNLKQAIINRYHSDVHVSTHGSRGFVPNNIVPESFLDSLKEFDTLSSPEKNKIKYIIVCGGANDGKLDSSTITKNIGTFINYAKANYPNATCYVGMIAYTSFANDIYRKALPAYKQTSKLGGIYLNGSENILRYNMLLDDHIHPNETGCSELSNYLINAFFTGCCDIQRVNTNITFNPSGICTEVKGLGEIREIQANSMEIIRMNSDNYNSQIEFIVNKSTFDKLDVLELGRVSGLMTLSSTTAHGMFTTKCYFRGGTNNYPINNSTMMCSLWIKDDILYFKPFGIATERSFWGDAIREVKSIIINDITLRVSDSYYAS